MIELKDPELEIKLFGKKIALPENGKIFVFDEGAKEFHGDSSNEGSVSPDRGCCLIPSENHLEDEESKVCVVDEIQIPQLELDEKKDQTVPETIETESQAKFTSSNTDETSNKRQQLMESDDNSSPAATDEETEDGKPQKSEEDQSDPTNPQQKTLKKPDKILPCPRCNSMDTKFCYYNNYNINQPRHFCKSCQRYWTAGGTMRNVPVGAGRRKNKNSASHCRHITISEALQAARIDLPNGFHHPAMKTNGTVLSFGPDMPLCESMASVLNLAEKKVPNGTRNGFYNPQQRVPVACKPSEKGDDSSSGSSVTTSNSNVEKGKDCHQVQEPIMQSMNGFPPQIACIPGVPWPYPWNSAVPMPAICPSGFPMPFFPAPIWNCGVPGPWGIPWMSPQSPSTSQKAPSCGSNSPTLGKHTRDGDLLKLNEPNGNEPSEVKNEGSILVPKTLRINDPNEAARSSIWATLGIKNEPINRKGLFRGFQPKDNPKNHTATSSLVLQANPAAMSRSLSFQENA